MLSLGSRRAVSVLNGIVLAALLVCLGGCKTQQDAAAAAAQMTATSQTLAAYYSALDHVVAETQDAYQAQEELNGTPVPPELIAALADTRQQIQLRESMAIQIGAMAALFQKLTASTAASDASSAAASLNTELVSIKALNNNDTETKAVTVGVQEIVTLIQKHDEVKAAEKIEPLCHNLSVFFDSEKDKYNSLNAVYLATAKSNADLMVDKGEVDTSPVFRSSLQPFGLSPAVDRSTLGVGLPKFLHSQVDAQYKAQVASYKKATSALSDALKEMDARITLVAHDKGMHIRMPPISLTVVEAWIQKVIAE